MAEKLDTVVPKITPLIRLLGSSAEHEVLAAVRMLLRVLARVGLDIHTLADRIGRGGEAPLSAAEMQRIYDAAYEKGFTDGTEHGRRNAAIAAHPTSTFAIHLANGVGGYSWQQIAEHCALHKHLFHGKDLEFVESIAEQLAWRSSPSAAQAKWLRDLFARKFGSKIV